MIKSKERIKSFNQYILFFITIVLSGSIIPFVFFEGYSPLLAMHLLILLVFFLLKIKTVKTHYSSIFFISFVIIFLLAHYFIKGSNVYLSTYVGLIMRFLIAFLITHIISFDVFIKKYVNIITAIVLISLIFYFGGIIFPTLVQKLPISYNDAGTGYRHAYIYFYQGIFSWNYRNSGIFWEGGAFQLYINLALMFRMFYLNKTFGRDKFLTLVLIFGIATTLSTVGILILLIQLYSVLKKKRPLIRYTLYFIGITTILLSGAINTLFLSKFSTQSASGSERLIGIMTDLNIFIRNPILGAGFEFIELNFKNIAYGYGSLVPSSTNSFTGSLALYGLIFTMVISITLLKLCFLINKKKREQIVSLITLALILSTQGVIFQLMFICLMFYAIKLSKNRTRLNLGGGS